MNSTVFYPEFPARSALPGLVSASSQGEQREKLLALLGYLEGTGYDFVAPTPATHHRVVSRPDRKLAGSITDILGWSLPAARGCLCPVLERELLAASVLVERGDGLLQPRLRVSRVENRLFWHSAYPTEAQDSVFLGPDSSRFAQLILAQMPPAPTSILDYGAGAGVGGIIAAQNAPGAMLTIADINPRALFLASVNAEHAGVAHRLMEAAIPDELPGPFDLIVTHPPFLIDGARRTYRDGGALHGGQLSLDWAIACAARLTPAGRFIMHTGAAIVAGADVLLDALCSRLPPSDFALAYRELDPDIFGDELDNPGYHDVDRIAAIGAVIDRVRA